MNLNPLFRRAACLLTLAALGLTLCACGTQPAQEEEPAPEEASPTEALGPVALAPILTLEEYPAVDGSTACLPLMAEVLAQACGIEDREEAESYVSASKTAQSWQSLINGDADLLLVYEMPESVREEWEESGVELEMTAIGRDALVFIVNEQNPVESLTQEQLIGIYTDQITNWSEVGGDDLAITPFQRDASSGSQTLFMKLLMGDIQPADAPTELRPGMMGALVEAIARYNNEGSAIGYSVYYYISEMYSQPGLRLMSVDGIAPDTATISDGSYPLTSPFYCAIRADEPEDSPARQLYDWMCGPNGQACLQNAGYCAVQ